jgi:hypothetical protein
MVSVIKVTLLLDHVSVNLHSIALHAQQHLQAQPDAQLAQLHSVYQPMVFANKTVFQTVLSAVKLKSDNAPTAVPNIISIPTTVPAPNALPDVIPAPMETHAKLASKEIASLPTKLAQHST